MVWKFGVARRADVDHRRHVERDHRFVERVPVAIGERRRGPVTARRIRVQVAADEAELVDAAFELANAVVRRYARRLRQLADADEVVGIQRADAVDQIVAVLRPVQAGGRVADVMPHPRGARGKDRHIRAALALQLQLRPLEALPDLVVRDRNRAFLTRLRRVLERGDLRVAVRLQRLRRRRVVTVAIDDHRSRSISPCGGWEW